LLERIRQKGNPESFKLDHLGKVINQMHESTPHLEIIPVANLVEHEWHDDQRTPRLMARIQESGVLRNPPIATPLRDGSQRFMVLDGANRVTALGKLNFPHVVVQIVKPDDQGLKLFNWNHVIWGFDASQLVTTIEQLQDIYLVSGDEKRPDLGEDCDLAKVQVARGNLFSFCTQVKSLTRRVELLNAILDIYKDQASLDRTNEWSVVRLKAIYPDLCGLVIFPNFEIKQVLHLAGNGSLLPTGITRFMVSPRVLHLNYPLEAMAADIPLEEKNEELRHFIQQCVAQKGVRYYAEATYLFDE